MSMPHTFGMYIYEHRTVTEYLLANVEKTVRKIQHEIISIFKSINTNDDDITVNQ
jgi:hypothetical protein